jgi:hypothetical protein
VRGVAEVGVPVLRQNHRGTLPMPPEGLP